MTKRFVHLHCHTNIGSPYDSIISPVELLDEAHKRNMPAVAITDHGTMNALAEAYLHNEEQKKSGVNVKYIRGIEFYYIEDIEDWQNKFDLVQKMKKKKYVPENDIKKMENEVNKRYHLVVWAQNYVGLRNLYRLVSESHRRPYYYKRPRIDFNILQKHCEGLIAASACIGGVLNFDFLTLFGKNYRNLDDGLVLKKYIERLRKFSDLFSGRFFGEIQWHEAREQHLANYFVLKACRELKIPVITTSDVHYINQQDSVFRDIYIKTRYNKSEKIMEAEKKKEDENRDTLFAFFGVDEQEEDSSYEVYEEKNFNLSFQTADVLWKNYKNQKNMFVDYSDEEIEGTFENTIMVSDMIEDYAIDTSPKMPRFILDKYINSEEEEYSYLYNACLNRLKELGLENDIYVKRLNTEMDLIYKKNFIKYFITMREIVMEAREIMGIGPARGSAAGSLVSYLLGITLVDPIKFGLSFSRFLTYDSLGFPDIDFDCEDPKLLKDKLIEKWGENRLVYVSNWNILSFKTVTKDLSKLFGVSFDEVNKMTKSSIMEYYAGVSELNKKKDPDVEEVLSFSETARNFFEKYPEIKKYVDRLKGNVRDVAKHAGGVIIGDDLFSDMPLIRVGDELQTPWPEGQAKRLLEPMGFIKFDVLGIATISEIFLTIKKILKKRGMAHTHKDVFNFYLEKVSPDKLNLNISLVYEHVFHNGNWTGVFQFTGRGVQQFCKKFKPKNIEELSIVTAVYRPGPLQASVDKHLIDVKYSNLPPVDFGCEEFREVTKNTYGFLIFQEQISELFCRILGISEDEGQKIRKLLTKKKGGDMEKIQPYKDKFFSVLLSKGVHKKDVFSLWEIVVAFAGYGFNKSHAVSYAIVSYQCAVLLTYYPEEWISSVLEIEFKQKRWDIIAQLTSAGYVVMPLSLDHLEQEWLVSGNQIFPPLSVVKGVGEDVVLLLKEEKARGGLSTPFDIYNFYYNNKNVLKKNVFLTLIGVGVFDSILKTSKITREDFVFFVENNKKQVSSYEQFFSLISSIPSQKQRKEFFVYIDIFKKSGIFYADKVYRVAEKIKGKQGKSVYTLREFSSLRRGSGYIIVFVIEHIRWVDGEKLRVIDERGLEQIMYVKNFPNKKIPDNSLCILYVNEKENNNYILLEIEIVDEKKN